MHHERLVELVEIKRRTRAQLDVHHRSLRECREHLESRLHRKDRRTIRHVVGHIHRKTTAIDRMKLRIRIPGFIKVNARY